VYTFGCTGKFTEKGVCYTCSHTCDFIPDEFTALHLANGGEKGPDLLLQYTRRIFLIFSKIHANYSTLSANANVATALGSNPKATDRV